MHFDTDNPNPKILCVDDEEINLEILEEALEDNYNLQMVESAEACLEFVNQCQPELILLDVNMPGMNGFEACKILKSNPKSCAIPIVFITALGREIEREEGFNSGGDAYVTKPFEEDILLSTINQALSLNI
ncbi:MAG: response regulator [Methylomarinum sp.]|nr:response regulator [Methylomarinum sp.]